MPKIRKTCRDRFCSSRQPIWVWTHIRLKIHHFSKWTLESCKTVVVILPSQKGQIQTGSSMVSSSSKSLMEFSPTSTWFLSSLQTTVVSRSRSTIRRANLWGTPLISFLRLHTTTITIRQTQVLAPLILSEAIKLCTTQTRLLQISCAKIAHLACLRPLRGGVTEIAVWCWDRQDFRVDLVLAGRKKTNLSTFRGLEVLEEEWATILGVQFHRSVGQMLQVLARIRAQAETIQWKEVDFWEMLVKWAPRVLKKIKVWDQTGKGV